MAHTPGPWETREIAHEATPYAKRWVYRMEIIAPQYLYGKRTHSRLICQMIDFCEWTDHPDNARLIASAPDLLEALQPFADFAEHWDARLPGGLAKHDEDDVYTIHMIPGDPPASIKLGHLRAALRAARKAKGETA